MKHHEHHDAGEHGPHHHGHHQGGAQTFRRGRVLEFLQQLDIKRTTLLQQLQQPELQSLSQVLSGELKAVELIRNEFIEWFALHPTHLVRQTNGTTAESLDSSPSPLVAQEPATEEESAHEE
jgi:hypothetical protein